MTLLSDQTWKTVISPASLLLRVMTRNNKEARCMQSTMLFYRVWLSVCLYIVKRWYCVSTNEHVVKRFLPSIMDIILVF